jgi:E3 ubiquitin-protein ligase SIAH1
MTNVNAVHLHDGFNFLLTDCPNTKQGAATSEQCLLLLTVARQPLGRTISMLCIAGDPTGQGPTSEEMECEISYSLYTHLKSLRSGNLLIDHHQRSTFRVACTDLSNGLPKPEDCFQFFVPTSLIGEHDKDGIQVTVRIAIK